MAEKVQLVVEEEDLDQCKDLEILQQLCTKQVQHSHWYQLVEGPRASEGHRAEKELECSGSEAIRH